MSFELLKLSSKEYGDILKSGEFSDTEILVGEEPNTKVFLAHSLILKIQSPYFRTAFSSRWVRTENNIIKLQKPNISAKVFDILIKYIYSSIIDLTKYDIKTNVEVLIAADELCLYDLCSYIENELLKNEALLKNNFILIHNVANKFNQFTNLLQFYRTNFQKDPNIILRTNDFTTIQKETLLNFLSEYRQSLNHTEVWDKLIEWAIAQSHELPLDVIRWTSSEITKFRGIIQSFIPHINFKEISPADFSHKVKPFRDIFDDKSYAKILEHYSFNNEVRSNFKMNIDSRIISPDHAFLIGNLIKITRQDDSDIFYDFNLLVRGSRDGFESENFHKLCDEKGPTITVISVKNTNEILGGFNPLNWLSNSVEYVETDESFIFSFDKNKLTDFIFSKVVDGKYAIYNRSIGPDFGHNNSDLRLILNSKEGQCYKNSYKKLIRKNEGTFEIDDYEIFQIINKST
ncbi:hypothetical protein RhiirA4_546986 [Rhizophagus irregularis]|uniref:Serine-enriched protein n=1 Tax=Rhizophagus irregularis TaxID=588596 RepID=A0A2I1GZS4_9GLOM|nr:hypothetical protein RhiirA4_546986 [Rhizophagus irregularis]